MDFGTCLVLHTPLGAGNDVAARPGEQKASVGGAKMALGCSNSVCYFPWLTVVPVLSPPDFHRR